MEVISMSIFDNMEKLDDARAPEVLDAGSEVKLRIISVKTGKGGDNDDDYISPRFEVVGNEFAQDLNHFLWVPTSDLRNSDKKKFEKAKWQMKEFMEAFGIDPSRPGDPEQDWVGCEGWAILGVKESDEYGKQNTIRKVVTGR
jgi:hypothetical protein